MKHQVCEKDIERLVLINCNGTRWIPDWIARRVRDKLNRSSDSKAPSPLSKTPNFIRVSLYVGLVPSEHFTTLITKIVIGKTDSYISTIKKCMQGSRPQEDLPVIICNPNSQFSNN